MKVSRTRYISCVAILSAISTVLMYLDFAIPQIIPNFVKMDFSELPALLASFALGPVAGVLVCLVKNLFHLIGTTTGGVGELSNFLLGASFVLVAGGVYRFKKSRKGALIGSVLGAFVMGMFSIISNYFLVYPIYYNFMPQDAILAAYQLIFSGVKNILQCLIVFNAPFTFIKGMLSVVITFIIYKRISPILKGNEE